MTDKVNDEEGVRVFWREEPLEERELRLYMQCLACHAASVGRQNFSTQGVGLASAGSGNYFQAIAAGLMTVGGLHGPLEETYEFLAQGSPGAKVAGLVKEGKRIPGWGNSFEKGEDLVWEPVRMVLDEEFPRWVEVLGDVTSALRDEGKVLWPNPSAYTAVTGICLGMRKELLGYLFVAGRLEGWSGIFAEHFKRC